MRTLIKKSPFRLLAAILLLGGASLFAQSPMNRDFGVGLILGEPSGATVKYWTAYDQALVGSVGVSRFDATRVGLDYMWHFDAFSSDVVALYAGPGVAVGALQGSSEDRVGARAMLGMNIVPRSTALEIFFEAGPLLSFPGGGGVNTSLDAAAGIRIYP
jgi:hypothetical protein